MGWWPDLYHGPKRHIYVKCRKWIASVFADVGGSSRRCIVIGGPSGSGKSTVATSVARSLCCAFHDADAYHPQMNVDKMRAGLALTDADRWPWLDILASVIDQHLSASQELVLACSALKESYRRKLRGRHSATAILFVLLKPSREELLRRVQARASLGKHFMPPALLDSQLSILETGGPGVFTLEGDSAVKPVLVSSGGRGNTLPLEGHRSGIMQGTGVSQNATRKYCST